MSLTYNCLFTGPAPDLHQLLDQLVDEHLEEALDPITEDDYFYFYESDKTFYLYYNEDNEHDRPDNRKSLLSIYPSNKSKIYNLSFGNFKVNSSWFIGFNKFNIARANEALARLLRNVLNEYEGDFVSLFNGEQIILYREAGRVYLNQGSDIAQEPMVSLLGLKEYELRAYKIL